MENDDDQVNMDWFDGKRFLLSGADTDTVKVRTFGDEFEDASCLRLLLDGKIYTAVEDPSDGYRSSLGHILVDDIDQMTNTFHPVVVKARYIENDGVTPCSIIQFVAGLDHVVAEFGTTNSDDYYPSFVGHFSPVKLTLAAKEQAAIQKTEKAKPKVEPAPDPALSDPLWGTF